MAIPSYTTDLATYNDCTSATGWGEVTNYALGAGPDIDTDLAIHGTICITQDRAKVGGNSQAFTGTGPTLPTDGAFFVWHKFFAPNSLDLLANHGAMVVIGSTSANFYGWDMDGSNTYAYGGWVNYAVDPLVTADVTVGSPSGVPNTVGNAWTLIAAPQKGNPFNTDIIRWGRGESRFTGGESANYATFLGYSIVNDNPTTGRFGLIQAEGTGYLYKGLMSLGLSGTAVDMRVSNTAITIDNTTKVSTSFNRIEVHNTASNIEWTAVNISSLSLVSRGEFEMIDGATLLFDTCVFTNMSTFIFNKGTGICDLIDSTWRGCDQVNQIGSTFTSCTFDNSIAAIAMLVNDISLVTKCTFNSDGTGHAVNIGSFVATDSIDWDNTESSYVTGVTGSPITTGTSGNETILCNVSSGQTLTINVASTGSTPSVKNDGTGTVNVVAGAITLKMIVKDVDQQPIVGAFAYIDGDNVAPFILNTTTDVNGEASISYSDGSVAGTTWRIRKYGYKPFVQTVDIAGIDISIPVTLNVDPQQT